MDMNRTQVRKALADIAAASGQETDRVFALALYYLMKDLDAVEDRVQSVEDIAKRIKSRQ